MPYGHPERGRGHNPQVDPCTESYPQPRKLDGTLGHCRAKNPGMLNLERLLAQGQGLIRASDHPRHRRSLYHLASAGRLQTVLPGVFAASGPVTMEARLRALCLWCPHGVLHERTAMALWLGEPCADLLMATSVRRVPPPGVTLTCRSIPTEFVTARAGIRLVRPAYAAVECASHDDGTALMIGMREGLIHSDELGPALAALAGTLGQRVRTPVVAAAERNPWSPAERLLQQILLDAGITGWVANPGIRVMGRRYHPDILFPGPRLVLEFDGYSVHEKRRQFHNDRERQNALVVGLHWVLRFTWEDLTTRPDYVVRTVKQALRALAA